MSSTTTTKATACRIPIWMRISSHSRYRRAISTILWRFSRRSQVPIIIRRWLEHGRASARFAHTNRPQRDTTRACGPNPGKPRLPEP